MSLSLKPFFIFWMLLCQTTALLPLQKDKPLLLMNATAHLGNGQEIDNAAVAFHQGKFTLIADATRIRLDMSAFEVVPLYQKHLYAVAAVEKDSLHTMDALYYVSADSVDLLVGLPGQGLTEGAEANLIVTDGSIGEAAPPEVVMAFLKGKKISLHHQHLQLLK